MISLHFKLSTQDENSVLLLKQNDRRWKGFTRDKLSA